MMAKFMYDTSKRTIELGRPFSICKKIGEYE